MSEELSRVEDLLENGVEEPVLPMSELEAILRGEKVKPHSRVAELLLQYNPQDILIEKSITENGTYYASVDNADGYFKVIVDTPVVPPTVLDHLVETITENGEYTYTPEHDGYSDAAITVSVPKPQPVVASKTIIANDTYVAADEQLDGYSQVVVNVPPTPLDTMNITHNGTYHPPAGRGFDEVNVTVPLGTKTITENGTYTATDDNLDGYSSVAVDVPQIGIKDIPNTPTPIASFSDGTSNPLKSLTASIVPVQDLHGYDSPWAGGAGKNKLDAQNQTITSGKYVVDNIPVNLPAGEYVFSFDFNGTSSSSSLRIDDTDGNVIYTISKSVNNGKNTIYFILSSEGAFIKYFTNAVGSYSNFMIEQGSTATSYAPYSNICPISGWSAVNAYDTGKNFYNPSFTRDSGYYDDNGVLQTSSTTGHTQLTPINSNAEYYFSIHARSNGGGKFAVYFWDANRNWISRASKDYSSNFDDNNITFTTPNNCRFISFQVPIGTNVTTLEFDDSLTMICLNSLGTDFEPYAGTTYTIPFTDGQGQSVEVFGGSVDVVSGGGKSNFAYIELPSTGWVQEGDETGVFTNYAIKADTPYPQLICSHAVRAFSYYDVINNEGKIGLSASRVLWHTTFATVEELEQYLANNTVQIAYELATPTTFHTQPTSIKSLDGVNNVFASTGQILSGQYFGYVYPELGTKTITENGTYDPADDSLDGYSGVTVTIPLGTKTITENGTYVATDDNLDGYSQVTIDVAGGGGKFPIYDFHENEDGTIVVRRKVDIVNGKMEIETKWFFNGYHMSAFLTDIPSNLLPFTRPNTDVSGKSYSDDTSATQNGWVAISTAYYQNKLVCYSTGWSSDSNKDVWAVIDINGGTQQALEWSDPYEDVGETKYYEYIRALNGQIIVRVEYPDAERTYATKTLWFFNGYYTDGSDKPIPDNLFPYLPVGWTTDVMMTSGYSDSTSETQIGWVGFLYPNRRDPEYTKFRTWTENKGSTLAGTFWGVLDIDGEETQIKEWFDPYENVPPRQIKNYGGTIEDGYNLSTELKTLGNVYHDIAMSYEIDNDSFDITWDQSGSNIGFSFNGDVDLKASDIQRISYKIDFGNCYDNANNQNIRPFVIGVTGTIRTTPSTGIYFDPSQVNNYFTKYKMYYKDVCNTTVEDFVDISDIEGPCYLFIVATGWVASITDLSMVSNSTPQIGTTLSQFNFFNYVSEDSNANKIIPIDTESFDVYWSGAIYIGHCLTGNIPLSGKKRLDIDMDYIGENYQHSSGTHTRNHNLAIVVTDIKVDSYVNLDNLERDNHIIAIKEWDGNDIYGQSIHTSIDLSNISGEYYINYQLPGFNIDGFKVRLYSTNAILPKYPNNVILNNKPIQNDQGNWITYNFDTPLTVGKSYLIMWSSGKSVDTHPFATAFTLVNSSENVSLTAHGVTATLSISTTSLVGTYSNDYDTRLRHINLLEIPSIFSDGLIF